MAKNATRELNADKRLQSLWENYELCRTKQLLVTRMPADPQGKKEKIVVIEWPSGFTNLPNAGGINDQAFLTMKIFSAFILGEREGTFKQLSSK